jgi:hypothetical protein
VKPKFMQRFIACLLVGVMTCLMFSAAITVALRHSSAAALIQTAADSTSSHASHMPCNEHQPAGVGVCAACAVCFPQALPALAAPLHTQNFCVLSPFISLDETFRNYLAPGLERPPQLRAA